MSWDEVKSSLFDGAIWTALGGIIAWLGQFLWQRRIHRDEVENRMQDRADKLTAHSESLAIELLKVAKAEASALRMQVGELQNQLGDAHILERRLGYFEEALLHIEALLEAENGSREAAEHNARLFIARMIALRQVKGNAANAAQVRMAEQRYIENGGDGK